LGPAAGSPAAATASAVVVPAGTTTESVTASVRDADTVISPWQQPVAYEAMLSGDPRLPAQMSPSTLDCPVLSFPRQAPTDRIFDVIRAPVSSSRRAE